MAKLVKLDSGVFYAGSGVTGQAVVDVSVDDIKEVTVKLHGRGQTGWTEHESVYDHNEKRNVTRPVHYTQFEDYCELRQTLWTCKRLGSNCFFPSVLALKSLIANLFQSSNF
jgi:hypothetical protein